MTGGEAGSGREVISEGSSLRIVSVSQRGRKYWEVGFWTVPLTRWITFLKPIAGSGSCLAGSIYIYSKKTSKDNNTLI